MSWLINNQDTDPNDEHMPNNGVTYMEEALSYKIHIAKHVEGYVKLNVDQGGLRVPGHLFTAMVPVSKRKEAFRTHLLKVLAENKGYAHDLLLSVHKHAKEKGGVTLTCGCKGRGFHAEVVKEYLESNQKTLDTILEYYEPTGKDTELQTMLQTLGQGGEMDITKLPEGLQRALMEQRLEEERDAVSAELRSDEYVKD